MPPNTHLGTTLDLKVRSLTSPIIDINYNVSTVTGLTVKYLITPVKYIHVVTYIISIMSGSSRKGDFTLPVVVGKQQKIIRWSHSVCTSFSSLSHNLNIWG